MQTRHVPRCLTVAASDSGGGAGIQADLRAFAAAGCHGASVIVALTAQSTRGISAVHEVPADFVDAQLDAVLDDIAIDAAKTGALISAPIVATVARHLREWGGLLVIDPVMSASAGGRLSGDEAIAATVRELFPLATVVTPNLDEAAVLARGMGTRREMAERIAARGAAAVLITGGHGDPVDHLFTGDAHIEIPVQRHDVAATHGSGCTHSATLAAELAKGRTLEAAARTAADVTARAVLQGITDLGSGEGAVDVTGLRERL